MTLGASPPLKPGASRRLLLAAVLTAGAGSCLHGCSLWGLRVGTSDDAEVVQGAGGDLDAAKRNAVASLFGLYLSSPAAASAQDVLNDKVLARAHFFIRRHEVVKESAPGPGAQGGIVIRAAVKYAALGVEIERLGIPAGFGAKGRAKVLIALTEEARGACLAAGLAAGLPAGREAGCASEALRRALIRRGFSIAAERLGADILVQGHASAQAVEDGRLASYRVGLAKLDLTAVRSSKEGEALAVQTEAAAVDLSEASAEASALDNAGDMAGDSLAGRMASAWRQDCEVGMVVVGLKDLAAARRLIDDLRSLPELSEVALVSRLSPETRLKVRSGLPSDELVSRVLGMRSYGFNVLAVGSDLVELEVLGERERDE
ncbi:MAG: hypothetical protein HY748_17305 [Elusimicrobia bacterium]|nr:hypothetical protein [Elusimicrobiota bacterium]